MRAVERTPWTERRSPMHDQLCLLVTENPARLITCAAEAVADLIEVAPVPNRVDRVVVEAPCGTGFCDVLIETDERSRAWFVEVKTEDERHSVGDVVRQLRWYASQRGGYETRELVFVPECIPDVKSWMLLLRAGVRVVPSFALQGSNRRPPKPDSIKSVLERISPTPESEKNGLGRIPRR